MDEERMMEDVMNGGSDNTDLRRRIAALRDYVREHAGQDELDRMDAWVAATLREPAPSAR